MADLRKESVTIERGVCHVLFAYDVGLSVDLSACERRITAAKERRTIRHRRRAPKYFDYEPPPLSITQQNPAVRLGHHQTIPTVEMVVYEFGAVSIGYRIPIEGRFEGLLSLSDILYDNESLLADSLGCVERLLEMIRPVVYRPNLSDAVEDYAIYEIQAISPPLTASELRSRYSNLIAQILRSEEETLSEDEVIDAHQCRISFGPADLAIIDWNAAMVYDKSADDVRPILEFANVELMEMRNLDGQLDKAMDESYEVMSRPRRFFPPLLGGGGRELRRVAQLQMDSALLFEGVSNALKLIGDQYLARVYRLASQRFHLTEWDASILRKLETLESIYQKLSGRAGSFRMELLEWIIIALIAAEIILSFVVKAR